jgi:hypothetical protein
VGLPVASQLGAGLHAQLELGIADYYLHDFPVSGDMRENKRRAQLPPVLWNEVLALGIIHTVLDPMGACGRILEASGVKAQRNGGRQYAFSAHEDVIRP